MRLAALIVLLLVTGCQGDQDRFEDVQKLRAIGVQTDPPVTAPSTNGTDTWSLQVFLAVPKGETITSATNYDDPTDPEGHDKVTLNVASLTATPPACKSYNAFQVCSVAASAVIPTADKVVVPADVGYVRLRYGITVATASEQQIIVGSLLLYPAGASQLSLKNPTINITEPSSGATVSGKPDLKASFNASVGENFRIGWYASGGNIDNRRAIETTWSKLPDSGAATILVTARGTETGAFAWQAVDVTVQ